MVSETSKNKYPMTGFSKITWEEFCGIVEMLKIFGSLEKKDQELIFLLMDGLRYRREVDTNN